MKLALIGASGFVGSAILKEALSRGHEVIAIARDGSKITATDPKLTVKQVDARQEEALATAVQGADAVVSAYNAGWGNTDLYSDFLQGSRAIEAGVEKSGVKRFFVIGGGGSLFVAPGVQLVDTPQFPEEWKAGAQAARDYLNDIRQNDRLDWTFLSPAIEMHHGTSGERKGSYRTGLENPVFNEQGRSVISVEDIAVAVIDELENNNFIQKRFTVAY